VASWRRPLTRFACSCGRPLQFDQTIHKGIDSEGRTLRAGHCSEDGWVGSDGKSAVVAVTPVRDA